MSKRTPVFEMQKKVISEREKKEILEEEALVKRLTESFEQVMKEQETLKQALEMEARMYGNSGHPSEE